MTTTGLLPEPLARRVAEYKAMAVRIKGQTHTGPFPRYKEPRHQLKAADRKRNADNALAIRVMAARLIKAWRSGASTKECVQGALKFRAD